MTLEELQAQVLDLQEQIKTVQQERDFYKTETETSNQRISELQEHNQKLFLRLTSPEQKQEEEVEIVKLEDYAKTISF